MSDNLLKGIFRVIFSIFGMGLIFYLVSYFITERLWFIELNYPAVFIKRLETEFILWAVVFTISLLFLLRNLAIAQRLKEINNNQSKVKSKITKQTTKNSFICVHLWFKQQTIPLKILLPAVTGLFLTLGLIFLHSLETALAVIWPRDLSQASIIPSLPSPFGIAIAKATLHNILDNNRLDNLWHVGVLGFIVILLLINLKFGLKAIAWSISIICGLVISKNWMGVLPYFQPTNFDKIDPLFNKDISFYVFNLPFWELLDFWLGELLIFAFIAVTLYLSLSIIRK